MKRVSEELERIRLCFNGNGLPGLDVMRQMAPVHRRFDPAQDESYMEASVLLLFYEKNAQVHFPLIVRADRYPGDKHRGQIAMPGGKREETDADEWHCALRETREELGIDGIPIHRIGKLTPHHIPVSQFRVHPFVAFTPDLPEFRPQKDEVDEILEIPFRELIDPGNKKSGSIRLSTGITLENIPYFDLGGHKVWGATAMMLHEFIVLFKTNAEFWEGKLDGS